MIIELKNASALLDPRVACFVREGILSTPGAGYGEPAAMLAALVSEVCTGGLGVLFDAEGEQLLGFAVLDGAPHPWRESGWVVHLYATTRAARRRLAVGTADWFRARGVYRVRAVNRSGASDAGFVRMFAEAAGWRGSVVGSVVEMEDVHGERRQPEVEDARHHA